MKNCRDAIQDTAGNAVNGATIYVTLANGDTPTIYTDSAGAFPYPSNVLITDPKGEFNFYAADGNYTLTAVKDGVTVTRIDVQIVDALVFASQIEALQGYERTLDQVSVNQVIVTDNAVTKRVSLGLAQDLGPTSDPTFRDLLVRNLKGSSAAPVPTYGTGAGANSIPTAASVTGDSLVFQLDLTPSATPAGGAGVAIASFAFQSLFAAIPKVLVQGNNRATRTLMASAASGCNVDVVTTAGFTLNPGGTALGAGPYSWIFTIVGK